jgi:hypothetical protein
MNKKKINNNVILMIKMIFFLIISILLINSFGYHSIIPLAILCFSYIAIIHHKKIIYNSLIHPFVNFVSLCLCGILPSHNECSRKTAKTKIKDTNQKCICASITTLLNSSIRKFANSLIQKLLSVKTVPFVVLIPKWEMGRPSLFIFKVRKVFCKMKI